MICKECGQQIADGSNFCENCGAKLGIQAETMPVDWDGPTVIQQTPRQSQPIQKKKSKATVIIAIIVLIVVLAAAGGAACYFLVFNADNMKIEKLLSSGDKFLLDGDFDSAKISFEEVIKIDPNNVDAYIGLAEAYAGLEDYQMAADVLADALLKVEVDSKDRDRLSKKLDEIQEKYGVIGNPMDGKQSGETSHSSNGNGIFTDDQISLINVLNEMSYINGVPVNDISNMSAEDVAKLMGLEWKHIADTDIVAASCPYQGGAYSADGSIIVERMCIRMSEVSEATMSNPFTDIKNDYVAMMSFMSGNISWFTINLDGNNSGAQLDLRYEPNNLLGDLTNASLSEIESKTFSENVFYSRFDIEGDDSFAKMMPKSDMPDGIDSVMILVDSDVLTVNTVYSDGKSYNASISDYGDYLVINYR